MIRKAGMGQQISIWRSAVAKPCQVLAVSLLCNGRYPSLPPRTFHGLAVFLLVFREFSSRLGSSVCVCEAAIQPQSVNLGSPMCQP